MRYALVASHPDHGTRRVELVDEVKIGRSPAMDLVLTPGNVAQIQARVVCRDGVVTIADGPSTIETTMNGVHIRAPVPLLPGDVVRLGDWSLSLEGTVSHARLERFVGREPREVELLEALHALPDDDALRVVYGDWLEENGYPTEAEVMALEREVWRGEAARLGYRLRVTAALTPTSWRAAVMRPEIAGCGERRCPRSWGRLGTTSDAGIRRCGRCTKDVVFAPTVPIARALLVQGGRVVVDPVAERRSNDLVLPEPAPAVLSPAVPVAVPAGGASSVLDLPFFARPEPPLTIGTLLASLGLRPPPALDAGTSPGQLSIPELDAAEPANRLVHGLSVRALFSALAPVHDVADLVDQRYGWFGLRLRTGGDEVEQWLEERWERPHRVVAQPSAPASPYAHYGAHWLLQRGEDAALGPDACRLEWHLELPEWALPETSVAVTLAFVAELHALLRTGLPYEGWSRFASRPPERSGIEVHGPLDGKLDGRFVREEVRLVLRPSLAALELAPALGIVEPMATRSGAAWHLHEARLPGLTVGGWVVDAALAAPPKGPRLAPDKAQITPACRVAALHVRRA